MLRLALTHRSYAFEHNLVETNERLEFLGDSVLGLIVTDYLFKHFPDDPESELAKKRSSIVSTHALAYVGRGMGLGQHILLGEGEIRTHGGDKDSILADTVESLIGASYLQQGYSAASSIVHRHVLPLLENKKIMGAGVDWKTLVQMAADQRGLEQPRYEITSTGPDHNRTFTATLFLGEQEFSQGVAGSKKEAERLAAWDSLEDIEKLKKAKK